MGEVFGAEQTAAIERVSTGSFELDSILSGGLPRGSLILISGNPGTGKTTLTSGFLYAGAKDGSENGIYVSFCEGKKSFYENQMTLGLDFARLEKEGHFRFMEMFTTTKEGMGAITGDILRGIKEFGAKRLVVDSYTVMTQALGGVYEGRQVLHTILGKIVRTMGCTTLVIGEQPTGETRIGDGAEEFVADGVLNLKLSIPRELEIRKMRGTRLTTRNVIYTIDHGFQVLRTDLRTPENPKKWQPLVDSGNLISTGSRDLDAILGGGLPRGAYAVVETADDVMTKEFRLVIRSMILNFINQRRGVMIVPIAGVDSSDIKAYVEPYTTSRIFNSLVRIQEEVELETVGEGSATFPPYVVPVNYGGETGRVAELESGEGQFYSEYKKLKERSGNEPIMRYIGYDNLESIYARHPEKLLNEIGTAIMRTKSGGDVTIGIAKPNFSILGKVLGMIDWHIKLFKKDEVLLIQGIKPHTNVYAADCDVSEGYPVMKLRLLT
jgi:KaiC/GvpD/RAD55 family RecA-like ATPase